MAYRITLSKACATRQQALNELWSKLVAMGWTLVDGSCSPVTVSYTAVSVANDTFTAIGHTFVDGQPVRLTTTGTAPTGLTKDTTLYYIRNVSGDTFKLATTYNGTAINITGQGTGNHTITEAYRVYSSNGESGNEITQYIRIFMYLSITSIQMRAAYAWDLTTHLPLGESSTGYSALVTTNETGFYFWIYGNKNFVRLITKIGTAYSSGYFGFGNPFLPLRTALSAPANAGSSVTLTVTSTEGFEANSLYQIVGASSEGRDQVTVTSITDSTHMVVSDLPRNYGTNALIGDRPCVFGNSRASGYNNYIYITCPARVVGLDDCSSYSFAVHNALVPVVTTDPDGVTGKYVLQPAAWSTELVNVNPYAGIGFMLLDMNSLFSNNTGLTSEDTLTVELKDTGTSSGSNDSTTLNDASKSWAANVFAGKVIVITFGTGVGQIKKIASNTATSISLASGFTFEIVPDATSQYSICGRAYRYFTSESSMYIVNREGYDD